MTAEERLNRVRNSWREFHRLSDRVEELEAIATKITPVLSDMPKGNSPGAKDDVWAQLIDYKTMCQEEIRWYLQACQELEHELDCINNPEIRAAMKYRYVGCYKIEYIAEAMNYNERSIRRLLNKGKRIYLKEYNNGN